MNVIQIPLVLQTSFHCKDYCKNINSALNFRCSDPVPQSGRNILLKSLYLESAEFFFNLQNIYKTALNLPTIQRGTAKQITKMSDVKKI